ncbi:putative alpha-galactosidase B [Leucoagaricus sp. SymC.cos]|nr:putative alpha-galactosidase B [Leucoagaricus sp. SymC.cos]
MGSTSEGAPTSPPKKAPHVAERSDAHEGGADEEDTPLLGQSSGSDSEDLSKSRPYFQRGWGKKYSFTVTFTRLTAIMTLGVVALALIGGLFAGLSKPTAVTALDNGVGKLPFMGWNTWNAYHCEINETIVLDNAKLIKSLGLLDVGYNYINIDDCYAEKERDSKGNIVASKDRFPSGMKNLTDQLHSMGFDSGWFTCQLYPGSYQNEDRDIQLFSDWGFDLLKYDNCAVPFDDVIKEGMVGKFQRMADAIARLSERTGKPPMLYSLCQWGREQPWLWARRFGQTWRTTDDTGPDWGAIRSIINHGNGAMTFDEQKAHFTAWALMKSPLVISTDLTKATDQTKFILKNTELIAIHQDPVVGTAVTPFRWGINPDWTNNFTHPAQYWSGETKDGVVFMLVNVLDQPADMFFSLTESPWIRAGRQYSVRDLWSHTNNGTAIRNMTIHSVPAHGVAALLLKDAGDEPAGTMPPCARPEWCMDQNGTRIDQ